MTIADYLGNIAFNASRLVNSLLGGEPDHSLSARIGWSIFEGGWWSRVPLPRWLREHFERAADDSAM